ncbi:site-specific integrase [Massilimicrobiota sp. An80]|uniref:tyrosine-type recombinase/integrase n=1 Tax=Massilimicrobiota sp. An80 TaxID=1965658 RepID=UPI000B44BFC5|nr:site-specific integrase [Massilimicrobiota sp. An80]OUN37844.1 hypothetical protein B5G32_02490 [Massilimicrobiota sp. An80]
MIRKKKYKFNNILDEWLKIQKYHVKESTYATYYSHINNHIKPYFQSYYLKDINQDMIQVFVVEKLNNGRIKDLSGLSIKTVKELVNVIKLCLKYCMEKGYIDNLNLNIKYPYRIKKMNILDQNEYRILVDYLKNNPNHFHIGILFILCTGVRIGEICALKNNDIDLVNKEIHIDKTLQRIADIENKKTKIIISSTKTKKSARVIPIPDVLIPYLIIDVSDNYFLTQSSKYYEPRRFRYKFKSLLKTLDISDVTVHSLRHYFATQCIELGFDYNCLSEILGHASPSTTMNLYVHCQNKYKQDCMNRIHI